MHTPLEISAQQVAALNCCLKTRITSLGRRLYYWTTGPTHHTIHHRRLYYWTTGLTHHTVHHRRLDYWTTGLTHHTVHHRRLDYWTDPPYSTSQVPAVSWPVELCSHKRQYWRSSCQQCRDMPLQRKKNRKHHKMCIYACQHHAWKQQPSSHFN